MAAAMLRRALARAQGSMRLLSWPLGLTSALRGLTTSRSHSGEKLGASRQCSNTGWRQPRSTGIIPAGMNRTHVAQILITFRRKECQLNDKFTLTEIMQCKLIEI